MSKKDSDFTSLCEVSYEGKTKRLTIRHRRTDRVLFVMDMAHVPMDRAVAGWKQNEDDSMLCEAYAVVHLPKHD